MYSEQAITVINTIISDSNASGYGGAIYSSKNVTIINTTITNSGSQLRSGGAVYSRENVTIINSTIINSTATSGNGGAVYCGNNAKVVNVIIKDSMVIDGVGGAIYSGNDVTAVNSTIQECSALNGKGGAIYSAAKRRNPNTNNFKPNIILSNCTFKHNSAINGGVLYAYGYYDHHMEFMDSLFESNEATTGGGVAFLGNTTLITVNSNFKNNRAAGDGCLT